MLKHMASDGDRINAGNHIFLILFPNNVLNLPNPIYNFFSALLYADSEFGIVISFDGVESS